MCLHMSAKARNEYIQLKKKRYRLLSGKKTKSQILNPKSPLGVLISNDGHWKKN